MEKEKFSHPIFDVLFVLFSLILYLFTIFDEEELFTEQKFFTKADFRILANFLNTFLYEIIVCFVSKASDVATLEKNSYFILFHQLLLAMHDKDAKQNTMEQMEKLWIIRDIKIKTFINDLSKGKHSCRMILDKIPHVIELKYRIEILQEEIAKDKLKYEHSNVRIKVRRNRLIEDGIDQINSLSTLKSTIRVKMVNEFGLSEAGIDQDGVFKEFLLDVIKKILNPEFNLFTV
jgi:ubiquitin-protein ligase E3 B